MSKTIEWDGTDEGLADLSDDDLKYLLDRSRITPEQFAANRDVDEFEFLEAVVANGPSKPTPIEDIPHTGDANTAGLTQAALEHKQARAMKEQGSTRAEDQDDDEDDVEYADMSNDDLRTELARRDLPVSGNKEELIKRLEADDEATSDDDEE